MAKHKVTEAQYRETVLNRLTKGDAFRLPNNEYEKYRMFVSKRLAVLTVEEIAAEWPHLTYDLKLKTK